MEKKNVEFETYHSNKKRIYFFCGFVCVVVILVVFIVGGSHAKYRVTQSIPLVNGTVNYELSDLNLVGVYIQGDDEYTKSDTIPESGYVLNEEESYCTVNGEEDTSINVSYDMDTKLLTVTPMTTTGTIYYADTSKGRTYYFAGNPTDNWVQFGGFYWRIIRINEDGTIRMIYQGTAANTTGEGTQTQTSAFNSTSNNNMYVGYMYESNQVHGLTSSSTIKEILDQWYQNNLTSVADKIDGNAGFCGDRMPYIRNGSIGSYTYTSGGGGTGTIQTYYGVYIRLVNSSKNPTFECENESDLYTTSGSSQGNGALTYPIGLVTADEVWYAGGYTSTNQSYYLYTRQHYWTMSPCWFDYGDAYVFRVSSNGYLIYNSVDGTLGVRL